MENYANELSIFSSVSNSLNTSSVVVEDKPLGNIVNIQLEDLDKLKYHQNKSYFNEKELEYICIFGKIQKCEDKDNERRIMLSDGNDTIEIFQYIKDDDELKSENLNGLKWYVICNKFRI